jgi:hypothetical protein
MNTTASSTAEVSSGAPRSTLALLLLLLLLLLYMACSYSCSCLLQCLAAAAAAAAAAAHHCCQGLLGQAHACRAATMHVSLCSRQHEVQLLLHTEHCNACLVHGMQAQVAAPLLQW